MSDRPILVVGVSQRSGTNFLSELLDRHPVTRRPKTILEDHLPRGAADIVAGIRAIVERHPQEWRDPALTRVELGARIGRSLVGWLEDDAALAPHERLLSKTPGAGELDALLQLCPFADIVVVVRDGRDVVASGMLGLGWGFGEGIERWLAGARSVLGVVGRPLPEGARVRVVRFEDLLDDLREHLGHLLTWLDLDRESYPWDQALTLPVYGSSFVRGGAGTVHWDPVQRPDGFEPRGRADDWDPYRRARFRLRAGTEMRALGYEVGRPGDAPRAAVGRAVLMETLATGRRVLRRTVGG